ncbi:PBECR2 nuclease fold domain-containing protein [Clostridium uliginosum]|uniref:Phage-Barnase-EndoU-ColicinE5/D-RelE like nuclease 3 domain-containing protein n=1 Tax=Clostridium uliginosum TaxID=119641 RepID=A0A1I1LPH8_9CLOT|nr:PBECR2 nuclease fold domain-containing protein [Clostridium uliginosum]SFC72183.1 hypothetical protein SAMN05421842_10841 [Clostridium uliginosum]
MRRAYKNYKKVGNLKFLITELIEFEFSSTVYASPGVINHIIKKHGKQLTKKVKHNIIETMEQIIKNPDYIGIDKLRGECGSFELIKKIDNSILLGLEVDREGQYVYVATMYPITESKINARLNSGRLISCNDKK